MKKLIKVTAAVMAVLMCCAVFAACGGNTDTTPSGNNLSAAEPADVKTETWGNITVAVPDGMSLKGGSVVDEKDPDVVNISKDDNAMNYFLITINDDEDSVKDGIKMTREGNDGAKDISFDAGESWTGVSYDFSGTAVMQIYAEFNGRFAVVQSYGFTPDDDAAKSVLSSLKVAAKSE